MRFGKLGLGFSRGAGGGSAPFSPLDLDPALWLDASDTATISQVAGAVSQWSDKSVSGYHAIQGTAASQPLTGVNLINGLNVLTFDGANDLLVLTQHAGLLSILGGDFTVFAVSNTLNTSQAGQSVLRGMDGGGTSTRFSISYEGGSGAVSFQSGTSGVAHSVALDTEPHLMSMRRSGTTLNCYYDEVLVGVGGASSGPSSLGIGRRATSTSQMLNGNVGEIVVLPYAATDEQLELMHLYLRERWIASAFAMMGSDYVMDGSYFVIL